MKHTIRNILASAALILSACTAQPQETAAEGTTYTGEGYSMEGSYTVHVTVDKDTITDVQVDAHFPDFLAEEFRQQGIEAVNYVAEEIKKNNAPTADMISGATVTCQAVLDGAYDALEQAGLMKEENYTLTDGTYEQLIFGNNDMIAVSMTVKDQAIASLEVLSEHETPGVGGVLRDSTGNPVTNGGRCPVIDIPKQIVEQQSFDVDMVTGATVTSYAVVTAAKECIMAAGGSPWLFRTPAEHEHPAEETADVVIVGAGGSGLAAAVRLAQEGKSVLLVDKNGAVGGNTLVCGAIYNAPDPDLQNGLVMNDAQKKTVEDALALTSDDPETQEVLASLQEPVREQWLAFLDGGAEGIFDSVEWYTLQTWVGGDMIANPELVRTLCGNAYEGLTWIKDMGMKFDDAISQGAGSLWQRTHTSTMDMGTGFISTYLNQLKQYESLVTIRTEYTASDLIMEGDAVVGVKAACNLDGSETTFLAKDGVILSTGGFSANTGMVQANNTSGKWPDLSSLPTTNRTSALGDGIRMAKNTQAATVDMDQIQLLYLGNLADGQLTKYPPRDVNGTDQIIFINKNGERFVREDGRRDEICLAILEQPDRMFYMLESADGDYIDITSEEWKSADGFSFEYLEQNGYVISDLTLEGLAEKLEMDADTLKATIDTFNASVLGEQNDTFGRTLYSVPLENGPWVSTPRQVSIHHTMGGLKIDSQCQVQNENGEVIKGLYAAGEVTGGVHGGNRLGGNAVVETVVFGKLAAESILAQ